MKAAVQLGTPPHRPLIVFDGDCGFCRIWIVRLRQITAEAADFAEYQDNSLAGRFPEIPRSAFESAVHLLMPDGAVFSGAEAVFRAMALNPKEQWCLDWYLHSKTFAGASESVYAFIARHRTTFSLLTKIGWGTHAERPTHGITRDVFLRGLGLIYLVAFVSLWVQIKGLVGSNGILPAQQTMEVVGQQAASAGLSFSRFHAFPTLCWLSASERAVQWQCAAGTILSALVMVGIAPAPALFLLWLVYLSLCTICREFLSFQWDILLLETGFLGIFFAPLQLWPRRAISEPSRAILWLLRWLLFRLMFESGCVKLLSGDPTWRGLTALSFHYETQPLPTWLGWYAHQLPAGFQKACTAMIFGVELAVPFGIFAPRRLRHISALLLIALQFFILATGNYGFFNFLSILLCLTLFDDAAFRGIRARLNWFRSRRAKAKGAVSGGFADRRGESEGLSKCTVLLEGQTSVMPPAPPRPWPWLVTATVTTLIVLLSLMQLPALFGKQVEWPRPLTWLYTWCGPFHTVNTYGLFAVMTTRRPEIVVEGSNDGVQWLPYEFKYKAGDLRGRPGFVEPHMPRLDWQMWFAALGDYRSNPWFVNFCARLLQNSPEVTALLPGNPFPNLPPKYIRAVVYEYHFTDTQTRRKTGEWWRREFKGQYLPAISLRSERQ